MSTVLPEEYRAAVKQLRQLRAELKQASDPKRAKAVARYFKTGPGDYGEGDQFYGISMPALRAIAKRYRDLHAVGISTLLNSHLHEERMMALIVMVYQFVHGDTAKQQHIYGIYRAEFEFINNWDLVDTSAPQIIGGYLFDKNDRWQMLHQMAKSRNLWERRIGVLATFYFIDQGQFDDSLKLTELLLHDKHDLIHKAVGWMLREIGKRSESTLKEFLDKHATQMPRTMLRYAIEKLSLVERQQYLRKV